MAPSVVLSALVALSAFSKTISAIRNITTPPIIIPLEFAYNTTFSTQSPGRFLADVSLGTPAQPLTLALDLSRPDIEIRHEAGNLLGESATDRFRSLLFRNGSSDSFLWGVPTGDLNGWLGAGPTDNMTLGNLAGFQTGWNRWDHTETINLSPQQRAEMLAYGINGYLGVHGPDCAVDGGSWFTSLVAMGGAPFRTWGLYFDGGLAAFDQEANRATHLDGDAPQYSGMLFLGGYQPSKFTGKLTAVANITYNNGSQLPRVLAPTSLPSDPHLLELDHVAVSAQRTVAPSNDESWFVIKPESVFSNFTTRSQAAIFAAAVGARGGNIGGGRTAYTFDDCTADAPTQNVELVFPALIPGEQPPRIKIPSSSLKILRNGTCYLSFQEPWDAAPPADQQQGLQVPPQPRGVLGLSFLRNAYIHTDYDRGAYFVASRATIPSASPNALSVYPAPDAPKFVLDRCWNAEGTATGKIVGEYQESWYGFAPAFKEYYTPIVGPPWVYRIAVKPTGQTVILALLALPLATLICLSFAWMNNKVGHVIIGKPALDAGIKKV
ncbi:hypothetical protein BDZ91DRAFT_373935 [Kalaharituber pfeilii]|nr:hypothetical protein BDZ91DRAFT_373935 [Kalaharituber pfeilii]